MKKAIIALVAVVGSSTAAMADHRNSDSRDHRIDGSLRITPPTTVSVPRPVMTRQIRPVYAPVATRPVSVQRPVSFTHDRDRDRGGERDRGHGRVIHPIVVERPVYRPIYQPVYQPVYQPAYEPEYEPEYEQTDYRPSQPVYAPTIVDNCDDNGQYVGPVNMQSSYGGWIDLTAPTALSYGRETFNLGEQVGAIDTLKLRADAGATNINTVQVQFLDGSSTRFAVRTTIDMGNPELTFNVGHRDVASVTVFGQSAVGSSFQVLAR